MKPKIKHIAISGNIGVGKTTLTKTLSKHFNWIPQYESTENNPYLNDFYNDMPRWSFNLQIFFLNRRLQNLIEIQKANETIIQDRTIYEDAQIFAVNLHKMGLMSTRDFENYADFFATLQEMIIPPDLIIHLKASLPTLVDQIQKRGRAYEENIRLDYLKRLNEQYDQWIEEYNDGPKLIIDCDALDFHDHQEGTDQLFEIITHKLDELGLRY